MLVACRLAGLSALGAHYAGVKWRAQCGACKPHQGLGFSAGSRTSRRMRLNSWAWWDHGWETGWIFPDSTLRFDARNAAMIKSIVVP